MSILGQKKSSFLSGNRPGENHLPTRIVECVSEYTFLISKSNKPTNKKNKNQKKQKKEEKRISPENRSKKPKIFRPPGSRFFSSLAFPEARAFFWLMKSKFLPRTLIKIIKNSYKNYKVAIR